jgi:hypothetical protein
MTQYGAGGRQGRPLYWPAGTPLVTPVRRRSVRLASMKSRLRPVNPGLMTGTIAPRLFHVALLVVVACALAILTSCFSSQSVATGPPPTIETSATTSDLSADSSPGHCTGRVGSVSVDGDVTVPAGATCELVGTVVEGNVSVGPAARLIARGVDVDGDIEGERTAAVEITDDANVGGNLQLESGGTALVTGSHVDGDVSWEEQHAALRARGNTVSGNLELDGSTGGVTVTDNKVGGDLICEDNTPAPRGGHNTVSGDKDGQCHDL